jgi:hypothetical protein
MEILLRTHRHRSQQRLQSSALLTVNEHADCNSDALLTCSRRISEKKVVCYIHSLKHGNDSVSLVYDVLLQYSSFAKNMW